MRQVNLYYLLPESFPTNNWMQSNADLQDEVRIVRFMEELEEMQDRIKLENYTGYFDIDNVTNFLEDFEIAEDCYPNPVFNLMRKRMQMWYNWREKPIQTSKNNYTMYGQVFSEHTFSEIAEHQYQNGCENFVLVNHQAHNCPSPIQVTINNSDTVDNECVTDVKELFEWFAENRLPRRDFKIHPKHGENRQERIFYQNREWASSLRCNRKQAFELLKRAIGDDTKTLFNRDVDRGDYYIVFKHEGNNPQNMYHGYHLEMDSDEVPKHIKEILPD